MENLYQLSKHIYILPFNPVTDRPNLGYIKGSEKVMMFDVGCGPKTTAWMRHQLKENNLPFPEAFIISHFHWDHSFAAGYVEEPIYMSQYTNDLMIEMKEQNFKKIDDLICDRYMPLFCKEHLHLEYANACELKLRGADVILPKQYSFDLGDITIELYEIENSHCPGAFVALIPQDKVLFIGDSNSGKVVGMDFIDNYDLLKHFYNEICKLDFDTIVLSHFNPYTRAEYCVMVEEKLKELKKN